MNEYKRSLLVRGAKSSHQYLTFCWDGDYLYDSWSEVEWRTRKTFSLSIYAFAVLC